MLGQAGAKPDRVSINQVHDTAWLLASSKH